MNRCVTSPSFLTLSEYQTGYVIFSVLQWCLYRLVSAPGFHGVPIRLQVSRYVYHSNSVVTLQLISYVLARRIAVSVNNDDRRAGDFDAHRIGSVILGCTYK